ncbi:hypothetical protein NYE69_06715 [Paenibacillus sp. FSL R5-0527]|uniref:hypothetical protein n=1 Tax=Paenibacillus sp. FSL R5-0527 TaxID=2975321 RepID=UPI0026C9B847
MDRFEKKLLNVAYESYSKSNDSRTKIRGNNVEEIMHYFNAAVSLVDKGLISVLSNNLNLESYSPFDTVIHYELTDLGLSTVQSLSGD